VIILIQNQRQRTGNDDQLPLANDLEALEKIILQQIWRRLKLNCFTKIISKEIPIEVGLYEM